MSNNEYNRKEGYRGHDDFFYPDKDEVREPSLWGRVGNSAKIVGAFVALLGMLYLSGIYQGFLFHRTPATIREDSREQVVSGEEIKLSVQAFVLVSESGRGSERTEEDVLQLIENANAIWQQAGIILELKETTALTLSDEEIARFLSEPYGVTANLHEYEGEHINLFLTRTLYGLNGIAFDSLQSTVVADYTTTYDFHTFAHEVGHILGLGHTEDPGRLMSQGSYGARLTAEEAQEARGNAQEF